MVKNALIRYNNFMTNINIKVVAKEGAKLPLYKTSGAAGADICALLEKPMAEMRALPQPYLCVNTLRYDGGGLSVAAIGRPLEEELP